MTPKDFMSTPLPFSTKVSNITDPDCMGAVLIALNTLEHKLPTSQQQLISGTRIRIVSDEINSGAQTDAKMKNIILDSEKNKLSLEMAENYLVQEGVLNEGDWTKAFDIAKTEPWSCLAYQLVHEFGHIVDGLNPGKPYERINIDMSPTKYGSTNQTETFAEVFAYWVFGLDIDVMAKQVLEKLFQI